MVVSSPFPSGRDANFTVTGNISNTTAASGNNGVSSVGHGPWFIETQTFDFEYERVPTMSRELLQDNHITLSSIDPVSGSTSDTFLICKLTASYNSFSSDAYYSSGLQVPQKFGCFPVSGDYHGDTYGTINPLSGHMGPQGTVNTTQDWYQRRLWQATDVEISESTNQDYFTFTTGYNISGTTANECFGDFRQWLAGAGTGTWGPAAWTDLQEIPGHYGGKIEYFRLAGQYAVSQETNARTILINMIQNITSKVAGAGGGVWDNYNEDIRNNPSDQVTQYRNWRHDFS